MKIENIRNFCIIAHIDHGKSTLADRILEFTKTVSDRDMTNQILDDMELERERGITIKSKAVTLKYEKDGVQYQMNLIDTPGHVDFAYEVSRSMASCEGALLLIDAAQGVEAQTVANAYHAIENNLEIIPIINKIDLPSARPEEVAEEAEEAFGIDAADAIMVSAKTGENIKQVLDRVVEVVPPPVGNPDGKFRALLFDAEYDNYRGVIIYVKVIDGEIKQGQTIQFFSSQQFYDITEIGHFEPTMKKSKSLKAGEVGYVIAAIKQLADVKIGDTIFLRNTTIEPFPGFKEIKPMVYCGFYPTGETTFEMMTEALEKLSLNDCSFTSQPDVSPALGYGYRCGFLGLLHMDIIRERIERENDLEIIQTAPNVTYQVLRTNKEIVTIDNPVDLPNANDITEFREPIAKVEVIIPKEYIGDVMQLCQERRGIYLKTDYIRADRVLIIYELPFAEIIYDFFDKLKSATKGYGTLNYDFLKYKSDDLVKMDILVNGTPVDALSAITHRDKATFLGRKIITKLKKEISRHLFQIPLQAAIGAKVVARENISAMRKDVTAKCYGGDVTRKRKLLEKQKKGKKRMKSIGNVEIPQEAFLAIFSED
ncbi:MAG: elongation factor 4 [Planctomycetota bacterium]|nr:MAG: elongation factor 4 [Planctomycetota bacterium]